MNFVFHYCLARRDLGAPLAGLGAMLPDVWRMADRRVRARPVPKAAGRTKAGPGGTDPDLDAVLCGIEHHLAVDAWFHRHPAFHAGERELAARFRRSAVAAEKLGLFAHIGWELCLDGALLRRHGIERTHGELRAAIELALAGPDRTASRLPVRAALRHQPALEGARLETFAERLVGLLGRIADSDWVPGYAEGAGLVDRLGGVRRRLGLAAFSPADRHALARVFEGALDDADRSLDSLAAVRTEIEGSSFERLSIDGPAVDQRR